MLDVKKLESFVAVARHENISRAARELNVTQPALSRQMRLFEEEWGWELFERTGKSVKLTHAGERVLQEGVRLLKTIEAAEKRLRREVEGAELRVGYAPSLSAGILERAMAVFCQLHPQVRLQVHDASTEEMWRKLREGKLDLMIEVATREEDFQWEELRSQRLQVAVPLHHPLAGKRLIKPQHLEGERLVLLSRTDYPGYWQQVTDYFREQGINAKVAGEFDGRESLRMGLEAGMGIAFVAEGTKLDGAAKLRRLSPEPEPMQVAVGWLRKRKLETWESAFVEELKRAAQEKVTARKATRRASK